MAWLRNLIDDFNKIIINTLSTKVRCWLISHALRHLLILLYFLSPHCIPMHPKSSTHPPFSYIQYAMWQVPNREASRVRVSVLQQYLPSSSIPSSCQEVRTSEKGSRREGEVWKGIARDAAPDNCLCVSFLLSHSSIHLTHLPFQSQVVPRQWMQATTLVPWLPPSFIPIGNGRGFVTRRG